MWVTNVCMWWYDRYIWHGYYVWSNLKQGTTIYEHKMFDNFVKRMYITEPKHFFQNGKKLYNHKMKILMYPHNQNMWYTRKTLRRLWQNRFLSYKKPYNLIIQTSHKGPVISDSPCTRDTTPNRTLLIPHQGVNRHDNLSSWSHDMAGVIQLLVLWVVDPRGRGTKRT